MAAPKGNTFAMGKGGGRPAAYDTPEDLANEVHAFFVHCRDEGENANITGLSLWLGFCSRSSLDDYAKRSEEFSFVIKRAKLAVENYYESRGGTFDIFALKNMGWKDKTETGFTDNDGNDITWNETRKYIPPADTTQY